MAKSKQIIFVSRLGIFMLQLVVIAALLWASDYAQAEADDDDNWKPPCSTEACKKTHPYYNTIPIPSWYRSNPPDVGKWYHRGGDDGGQVWVPGLTDDMDQATKDAYYEIKSGPLSGGWKVVRKEVAAALQLAQDYPSAKCHDNMAAAAAGHVQMTCTYKDNGETKTKTFKNMTTVTFNDYFDDQFMTVAEYHNSSAYGNEDGYNHQGGSQGTNGGSDNPYAQYYDSHGNLIYNSNGTNGGSNSGGAGYAQGSGGTGSAYARYITNHVAPNYSNINRSTAAVFSMGNEQGLTLEEILKKQKAEYAPGINSGDGKDGSGSGANAPKPTTGTQNTPPQAGANNP